MALKFEDFPEKSKFVATALSLPNPLDPRTASTQGYVLVQPETAPSSGVPRDVLYSAYIPPALIKKYGKWLLSNFISVGDGEDFPVKKFPVNLTLFFSAPDNDLSVKTLGLRYFLRHVDDTFVIVIPNFETHGDTRLEPKNAGITTDIINKLVAKFSTEAGFRFEFFDISVTCVTAYSAGYGGLIQSINNDLFKLEQLKKIVFYDCLYRGDSPRLPQGEQRPPLLPSETNNGPDEVDGGHANSAFNTRRAIIKAKAKSSTLEVIAYCATSGGSPKYLQGSQAYTVSVDKLIELRGNRSHPKMEEYSFALSITRALMMAKNDGIININKVPKVFVDLYNTILPQRGQIASVTAQLKTSKTGFTPTTTLEAWGKTNQALIDKAKPKFSEAIDTIGTNSFFYKNYPSIDNQGGMLHIAQIFEFAWEEFI
jgi:hypothetical protein